MKFRQFIENDILSYSKKPIASYLNPALAKKVNDYLPDWQTNDQFLQKIKTYLTDSAGDEFIQANPQSFEKSVIQIAIGMAQYMLINRGKEETSDLETKQDTYERCSPDDGFERIMCGIHNCERTGMPTFDVTRVINDKELKGYYGVHVGRAASWLNWLVDDGYCDGDIYIYRITIPEDEPFYQAEDVNSGGYGGEHADRQVPSGQIIFSQLRLIPAEYIKLTKFIKEKNYWKDRKRSERQGY